MAAMDEIEADFQGRPLAGWIPLLGDEVRLVDGREGRVCGISLEPGGRILMRFSGNQEFSVDDVAGVLRRACGHKPIPLPLKRRWTRQCDQLMPVCQSCGSCIQVDEFYPTDTGQRLVFRPCCATLRRALIDLAARQAEARTRARRRMRKNRRRR
jgi:hypothetical protein